MSLAPDLGFDWENLLLNWRLCGFVSGNEKGGCCVRLVRRRDCFHANPKQVRVLHHFCLDTPVVLVKFQYKWPWHTVRSLIEY